MRKITEEGLSTENTNTQKEEKEHKKKNRTDLSEDRVD